MKREIIRRKEQQRTYTEMSIVAGQELERAVVKGGTVLLLTVSSFIASTAHICTYLM